jgi:hypothetical protein
VAKVRNQSAFADALAQMDQHALARSTDTVRNPKRGLEFERDRFDDDIQ